MTQPEREQDRRPRLSVGIMGGTFDPIHCGHLAVAEAAAAELRLDSVALLPARCPPHRDPAALTPFEHRLAMIELAISGKSGFFVCTAEADLSCPTYAGDAVRIVRAKLGVDADFHFIAGMDAMTALTSPAAARMHPDLADFIVAERPGWSREKAIEAMPEGFVRHVRFLRTTGPEISSSEIRSRIGGGIPVRGLVPPLVAGYIRRHGLYGHSPAR